VASRQPDLSGADVPLRDEGECDGLRGRHTERSHVTLAGKRGCLTVDAIWVRLQVLLDVLRNDVGSVPNDAAIYRETR
jgi:hypothetical protein